MHIKQTDSTELRDVLTNLEGSTVQLASTLKRLNSWRMRVAIFAIFMAAFGVFNFSFQTQQADAALLAPQWLVNYIRGKARGQDAQVMGDLGYQCAGTPYVCWQSTSYDPPRWFYYGVVDTGNGAGGYVRARGWASTASNVPVIRTFPEGWKLVIFCQTYGNWVYGRWGWTNVWDYVGHYGEAPMFVSDGFVRTGSNSFVAGNCGATNMGGNP